MAVGAQVTVQLLWPRRLPVRAQSVVLGVIVAIMAVEQLHYYFETHLPIYNEQILQYYDYAGEDALFRSADFPPGTVVHIVSDSAIDFGYGRDILRFLNPHASLVIESPAALDEYEIARIPRAVDNAFFVQINDIETIELLHSYFELDGPYLSPNDIPLLKQLLLFYAHAEGRN
jgi:hypothetical protein